MRSFRGLGLERNGELQMDMELLFGADVNILELGSGDGCTI